MACVVLEVVLAVGAWIDVQRAAVEYRLGRISFVGPSGMVRDAYGLGINDHGTPTPFLFDVSAIDAEPSWVIPPSQITVDGVAGLEESVSCFAPVIGGWDPALFWTHGVDVRDQSVSVWFPSRAAGLYIRCTTYGGVADWLQDREARYWVRRIVDTLAVEAE